MTLGSLFSLEGDKVLVTGATGHLGKAMSMALCEAGATVYLNGRNEKKVDALVSELTALGHGAKPLCFDIRDDDAVAAAVSKVRRESGRLNALINNAYSSWSVELRAAKRQDYLDAYDMTVASAAMLVNASLDLLEEAATADGSASIINIATMYASVSPDPGTYGGAPSNPPNYGPAKAALVQWTRYLACHLGARGIRANAISPGPFPNRQVVENDPDFAVRLASKSPLGRIGQPDDLKGVVVFLASRASRYVTGANIPVDGGWTAW